MPNSSPYVFTNGDRWDVAFAEDFTRLEVRDGTDTEHFFHLLIRQGNGSLAGMRMTDKKAAMLRDHLDKLLNSR